MVCDGWQAAKNILCVRLDSLGDVLLTSPAFAAMKHGRPESRLTLLTSPSGAAAGRLIPEIDDIVVYESPWMKPARARGGPSDPDSAPDRQMIERLAAAHYEAAVIFTVYSQSPLPAALLCHLADIPLRLAHCRENPYHLLSDWVREPEPDQFVRHEVQRQLDLVATVGAKCDDDRLRLAVPEDARRRLLRRLAELGINGSIPWLVMHPGSTAASRRYPPEKFAVAADRLAELDFRVIFTGDRSEHELVESIRQRMNSASYSLCGQLELAELAALVEAAPVVISNNTAPVHVAAAVGTPVVDLYALTNPQHTPWRVPHRVLFRDVPCKYCYKSVCPQGHHDCLRLVEPEQVVQATIDLLTKTGRQSGHASNTSAGTHCWETSCTP